MTSESALTGRTGKFVVEDQLIARTTKWDVKEALATKSEWGDSDSAGYTNRSAGRMDATFSAEGKFDTDTEQFDLFAQGDIAEAVLWMSNVDADALYWAFPRALCLDFSLGVNIDTEEVIGWTSNWGADGEFFRPGQSGAPTHTVPTA